MGNNKASVEINGSIKWMFDCHNTNTLKFNRTNDTNTSVHTYAQATATHNTVTKLSFID